MEKIGYVYLTTNLVNGKQYVGQHLATEFDTKYKGSGTYITRALNKYGWSNFDCKVVCWCATQTQLNEAEDNYIKLLDTMVPNGYNLKGGGANGKYSMESRIKMSKSMKGIKRTEEARKKMSEAKKGHIPWNKGKSGCCSEEFAKNMWKKGNIPWNKGKKCENISKSKKGYKPSKQTCENISRAKKGSTPWIKDKHHTKETCLLLSKLNTNNPKISKKVFQYTLEGKFVAEYPSIREAARVNNFHNTHISACCLGKRKTSNGFKWSLEPPTPPNNPS